MNRLFASMIPAVAVAASVALAQTDPTIPPVSLPEIPDTADTAADLVPEGWRVEEEVRGDLNGDDAPDLALVLRMEDPENVIETSDRGDPLDTNPRLLVVAFADPETGALSVAVTDSNLIPRHTNPQMEDPFHGVEIARRALRVSLGTFMISGGWSITNVAFAFRHQDGCFRLIGYDALDLQRNTMRSEKVSVNYLTKKVKRGWGYDEDRMNETWGSFDPGELPCLGAVGDGLDFAPGLPRSPDRAAALLKASAETEPQWTTEIASLRLGPDDTSVGFEAVRATCSEEQLRSALAPAAERLRECSDGATPTRVRVAFADGRIASHVEPDDEAAYCITEALDHAHFDDLECTFEGRLPAR